MDIREKAKQYADGKALTAINAAIEEAYAEGYKSGYEDGYAKREEVNPIVLNDGVEYVDLALPSGTKWSSCCLKRENRSFYYFSNEEALKYNLPTKEQFDELKKWCMIYSITDAYNEIKEVEFIGRNGNKIKIHATKLALGSSWIGNQTYRSWLKDEVDEINGLSIDGSDSNGQISKYFKGYHIPIMLVR